MTAVPMIAVAINSSMSEKPASGTSFRPRTRPAERLLEPGPVRLEELGGTRVRRSYRGLREVPILGE